MPRIKKAFHEDSDGSSSSGDGNADDCDRRLSRAARNLLQQHLLAAAPSSYRLFAGNHNHKHNDDNDVWTLLDHWLRDARPSECLLFSSRDILRVEEEHSIPLKPVRHLQGAYPATTIKERRKYHKTSKRWWKCGFCSKLFHSRYYLDLHFETHHHHHHHHEYPKSLPVSSLSSVSSEHSNNNNMVCPAKEWCQFLGHANCHMQALQDEPYYAPGSDGWDVGASNHGNDHSSSTTRLIQHGHLKVAQSTPCNLEQVKSDCRVVLHQCRVSDMSLCESLTCPQQHYYHHEYYSSSFVPPLDWHSKWETYERHYGAGSLLSIGACLLSCLWVYYMVMVGGGESTPSTSMLGEHKANKRNLSGKTVKSS